MTTVINLYGGPGTGKSTMAAYMYYLLKKRGKNVELVREYVKDWVWEGRSIGPFDQFYIMAKHMRMETRLYDKVDTVISDSPLILPIMYARMYSPAPVADGVQAAVQDFYEASRAAGHIDKHVFLTRVKPYRQEGRYQNEQEAKALDGVTKSLLDELGVVYDEVDGTEGGVGAYLSMQEVL